MSITKLIEGQTEQLRAASSEMRSGPLPPEPEPHQIADGPTANGSVDGELETMSSRPDNIPKDVWDLIQANGELATQRLNELLTSSRFIRFKPSDQAKIIQLAQNRAYGTPSPTQSADARRLNTRRFDVTQKALDDLRHRAMLPEYSKAIDVDDEEEL